MVNARPVPPRSSDAYPWGNFKINTDRIACATENTTTATMSPDNDNETPGTTPAATRSPIAHDPRSTAARSTICPSAISVGLGAVSVKNRVDSSKGLRPTVGVNDDRLGSSVVMLGDGSDSFAAPVILEVGGS